MCVCVCVCVCVCMCVCVCECVCVCGIKSLFHSFSQPTATKGSDDYYDTYREEWREVFIISAELYAFGIIIYLLFASGKKQSWADGVGSSSQHQVIDPEHIEKHLQDSSGTYPGKQSSEKHPISPDSEWKKISFEPQSNYGSMNSEPETN